MILHYKILKKFSDIAEKRPRTSNATLQLLMILEAFLQKSFQRGTFFAQQLERHFCYFRKLISLPKNMRFLNVFPSKDFENIKKIYRRVCNYEATMNFRKCFFYVRKYFQIYFSLHCMYTLTLVSHCPVYFFNFQEPLFKNRKFHFI